MLKNNTMGSMIDKITFCIPSKNNLRYLKGSIRSIQKNSSFKNEILVFIDGDNDGTIGWLKENDIFYIVNPSSIPQGIAYGYNRCIEAAKTDVLCMFHADMFMGKGFDENLLKHLKPKTIVAATRIEPPLHPAGLEKIVQDFGMYPEDFDESSFESFVANTSVKNKGITTRGIFAPWICFKKDITEIGMHDELLHSYYEDSDIFQRFILNGCTMIQAWDALVYHFTCRGGQFQDGVEKVTTDEAFLKMRVASQRYYVRKWGSWISNDQYQHPILHKVYNSGFVIRDVTMEDFLYSVEPWATHVYVDNWECAERYIAKENPISKIDLRSRIFRYEYIEKNHNDVLLEFSQKDFMANLNDNLRVVINLPDILSDGIEDNSEFEYGIFKMKTKSLRDLSLIKVKI